MTIEQLDFYFPFFVFCYGLMLTIVLNWPQLIERAESVIAPQYLKQLKAHRGLSILCLWIGGLWSLQNLLL